MAPIDHKSAFASYFSYLKISGAYNNLKRKKAKYKLKTNIIIFKSAPYKVGNHTMFQQDLSVQHNEQIQNQQFLL